MVWRASFCAVSCELVRTSLRNRYCGKSILKPGHSGENKQAITNRQQPIHIQSTSNPHVICQPHGSIICDSELISAATQMNEECNAVDTPQAVSIRHKDISVFQMFYLTFESMPANCLYEKTSIKKGGCSREQEGWDKPRISYH